MIKLGAARLLPGAVAGTLLWSALSPLAPALDGFARASRALAGETNVGGVDFPSAVPKAQGAAPAHGQARALREIAHSVEAGGQASESKALGWEAGDRAVQKLGPKKGP